MEYYKNKTLECLIKFVNGVKVVEQWKPAVGYENFYEVSNFGRIKCLSKGTGNNYSRVLPEKIASQRIGVKKYGNYCLVNFCVNGIKKVKKVHRLVAEAFLDNNENKPQVNHIDGVKTNNSVENLEWATQSENIKHAFRIGLNKPNVDNPKIRGSAHVHSKLTETDVLNIRKLSESGMTQKAISKIYGVHPNNINVIVLRKTWKHI